MKTHLHCEVDHSPPQRPSFAYGHRQAASSGVQLDLFISLTSRWHIPDGMGQENLPRDDGARGDGFKAWTSTIVVTSLWPAWHYASPATLSGIWTFGLFHLYYTCLCAASLSPLSLPSKFRTQVQACKTSQGSWLWEYKSRTYLVLPSGWLSVRLTSGSQPAEAVEGALHKLNMHLKFEAD